MQPLNMTRHIKGIKRRSRALTIEASSISLYWIAFDFGGVIVGEGDDEEEEAEEEEG